ncbi:MAG: DUF3865 domain-containing protein [Cyanobacteriota bacterium]
MSQASISTEIGSKTCIHSEIDRQNYVFINDVKAQLANLEPYTTAALEWLMLEHYQFSFRNTKFLATAAAVTESFDTDAIHKELLRNLAEENNHAAIYKAALKQIDIDVETRQEFKSTTIFLETIGRLSSGLPSSVLGTMFATETAAIFEHEVFKDVSEEVLRRRGLEAKGQQLVGFHDMHLSGVEQSHRNELGIFLEGLEFDTVVERKLDRPTIDTSQAVVGAEEAIAAMKSWWSDLLTEARAKSQVV